MYTPASMSKSILNAYYLIKPAIPRAFQLWFRRTMVQRARKRNAWQWPILELAGRQPVNWPGWPDGKRFAVILTHDVEHAHGVSRCKALAQVEQEFGFCSSFNFVPERYEVPPQLREWLVEHGFEVGVHGLKHDGRLYESEETFMRRAEKINRYIQEWDAVGFRSPAMHHNLEWIGDLDIDYDLSTFDTDPFEPQSDGVETIFPFLVERRNNQKAYIEMPYTLPQDHMLYIIMQEQNIDIWKQKVDWLVESGGMVLINIHPDYVSFGGEAGREEYSIDLYRDFLEYIVSKYSGEYWAALPREVAEYYRSQVSEPRWHCRPESVLNDSQHNQLTLANGSQI